MKAMGGLTALPSRVGVAALLAAIWVYQRTVSPLIGPVCRFQPSCSRYMAESLRKYGLVRGLGRGIARLARCHPWHPGGYDPP